MENINKLNKKYFHSVRQDYMRVIYIMLIYMITITSYAFASGNFDSGMTRINLQNFQIFSGSNSDRDLMLARNFNLPVFMPYNNEKLVNIEDGDNYHVFKTSFNIPNSYKNKDLTLYISCFDMPVIIRLNNIIIHQKGLRPETNNAYSTGETAAVHIPLSEGLINYNGENILIAEVFPQYETSSLPELSIAEYKDNAVKVFIKNLLNVYLVLTAQLLAFLVALYHFFSFFSRGRKDAKYLYFSLLSFSFALGYANIGFSFDSEYYTLLVKITRSLQLYTVGFYLLFIFESVGILKKQKKYIAAAVIIYSIICAAYVFVQEDKHAINIAFSLMTNIYMIPVLLLCVIIPAVSFIIKKNYTVALMLFITLIIAGAGIRDMMLLSAAAQPLFWFAPYGFLLLVIVIYGILVFEESSLFKNFKRYVPADLVIQLINQNITANLGGKQQELTVFFSDISKFTSIVEEMDPEKLIQDLCVYFEGISKIILANNGTIDKYIGDAVMAFWGAPVQMNDHAKKACNAAIAVQNNLHTLFNQWNNQGKAPFLTRIGIHTGTVLVGNLGYKERLNYTVIGDTVNVSSRLESINKIYGTEIIVSENVYKKCPNDFEFRYLDRVSLLGRYHAMNIYELISTKDNIDELQKKINEHYEQGLKNYFDKKWLMALKHFNTVIKYRPNDSPSRLMRGRCLLYKDSPPPENWDGVFIQTEK